MIVKRSSVPIRGLIGAEFLSLLGNQVATIAIPILVLKYTHSTMLTGIAVAANTIPYVIAAFIGGSAIDKFGARTVSIAADVLSGLSVMALPVAFGLFPGNVPAGVLFFLIFAGAVFDPTGVTARHTMVPGLTKLASGQINKINTLRGGLENAADFAGPAIGVGLIGLIGISNTFYANAVSFFLCAMIIAYVVPKRKVRKIVQPGVDIFFGVRFIFNNAALRTLAVIGIISSVMISSFFGLLLSILAVERYNNYALFGICMSALGISATLSALSFAKLSRMFSYSVIYYGGLLVMGLGMLLSGLANTPAAVVASVTLAGLMGAGNPLEQTILQEQTPGQFAGQVFAALPAIRFFAGTIGILIAGYISQFISIDTVLICGGALVIITATLGWVLAPLKQGYHKK